MNILITNSVPLNGGDEALLRATMEALQRKWPQSAISVLCKDVQLCQKYLPDLVLASDLEFVSGAVERERILDLYRSADIILSAPGGFLHDYYDIEHRLQGFETALDLDRPVILFAQSVGPFWKPASLKRVPEVFNRLSAICVRDQASTRHLLACGVKSSLIRETADAAFLWRELAPELFSSGERKEKRVGLCFRVWPLGDTVNIENTLRKAHHLCRHILADGEREILFLSTCQGIKGYVDDSLLARQIVSGLPDDLQNRCHIDTARYSPRALIQRLQQCEAFIGMRLHACLSAMLAGVPAAGLGYEQKTEEIYSQLGFEYYQTNFSSDEASWLMCVDRLLNHLGSIRNQLPDVLDRLCIRARSNLDVMEDQLPQAAMSA